MLDIKFNVLVNSISNEIFQSYELLVSDTSAKITSNGLLPMKDERSTSSKYNLLIVFYGFSILASPHLLSHSSMSLLRSVIVTNDRNSSPTIDHTCQDPHSTIENTLEQSSMEDKTEPKLRTFGGWKRNTAHLNKSRLSKSVWLTHVSVSVNKNLNINQFLFKISSEPTTPYDATKEMNNIFRPVRYEILFKYNEKCPHFFLFFTLPVKFKRKRERDESI